MLRGTKFEDGSNAEIVMDGETNPKARAKGGGVLSNDTMGKEEPGRW